MQRNIHGFFGEQMQCYWLRILGCSQYMATEVDGGYYLCEALEILSVVFGFELEWF